MKKVLVWMLLVTLLVLSLSGCKQKKGNAVVMPEVISGVQDMERLWDAMRDSGITPRQIDKIASENVKRVMQEVGRKKETFLFRR